MFTTSQSRLKFTLRHGQFCGHPEITRLFKPKQEQYAGYVSYMDHLVGRLTQAVDKAGIAERTRVVFVGDNGSSAPGTLNGVRYQKGKGQRADRGVHVPFIVRAPFLIP